MSKLLERVLAWLDARQRRWRPTAFAVGVVKKFNDDDAGHLAAVITYYAFVSIFPMLLIFLTVVGFVFGDDPGLRRALLDSALADFPVVGTEIRRNVGELDGSGVALIVGLAGLLWGSLGAAQAAEHAMAEVWNLPKKERPGFVPRLVRALLTMLVIVVAVLASTALASVATLIAESAVVSVAVLLLGVGVNVGVYFLMFRVLTPSRIATRDLWPGAIAAGVAWTILQLVGGWLVARQLRQTSELYGFFAIVLGLLFFLFLVARITLYAAELNVVRVRRLYPRSLTE